MGEVRERRSAPQLERLTGELGCRKRVAAVERGAGLVRHAFEPERVDTVRPDAKEIAGWARLEDRLAAVHAGRLPEQPPQLGHVIPHLGDCCCRRALAVETVGNLLHWDNAVRLEQEDRKDGSLARTTEPDRFRISDDLDRAEHTEFDAHPARTVTLRDPIGNVSGCSFSTVGRPVDSIKGGTRMSSRIPGLLALLAGGAAIAAARRLRRPRLLATPSVAKIGVSLLPRWSLSSSSRP